MSKLAKRIILLTLVFLLLGAALAVLLEYMPYYRAGSTMPSGQFQLQLLEDGNLLLSWPAAKKADCYCVELYFPPNSEDEEPVLAYQSFVSDGCSHELPHLPENQELILRVNTVVEYRTPGQTRQRYGETPLEVRTAFRVPEVQELTCTPEPEGKKASLDYTLEPGDACRIYCIAPDGTVTLLETTGESHAEFSFGQTEGVPMPEYDQQVQFYLEAYRETPGLRITGKTTSPCSVCREDLLGRELNLRLTDNGDNVVTLSWEQTKGAYYEVQQQEISKGSWTVLTRVDRAEACTYTTAHLPSCRDYVYRVVAVGGQVMEDSQVAAVSQELSFSSGASTTYCTIWPVNNLKAYSDPELTQEAGSVEIGKAYCVLEEVEGAFAVRLDGEIRYIDSNYCMINLPEYLGPLCAYNITNSYDSLYMVHEYEIPEVTGVVTAGYEQVRLADGSYLVPLLYPTARKLLTAAETAKSQGYRLKIYDAYRPNKATREIYDLTQKILEEELPEQSYTGRYTAPETITYRQLMTNGTWSLGSFLAAGGSLHNLGIALDLTLEDWNTGRELAMQSSIHDLSWYSVLSRNNANANTLASIMKGAGLGELVSEWWHFQDNEARSTLKLPTVYGGVSPECWMTDGIGWRYRRYNGTYFVSCDREIGGVTYTFDENGYAVDNTAR